MEKICSSTPCPEFMTATTSRPAATSRLASPVDAMIRERISSPSSRARSGFTSGISLHSSRLAVPAFRVVFWVFYYLQSVGRLRLGLGVHQLPAPSHDSKLSYYLGHFMNSCVAVVTAVIGSANPVTWV